MKKLPVITLFITLAASAASSSAAVLVAGWDTFDSPLNPTATHLSSGTTATLASSATGGNWSDWNNNELGASPDGTFGNLSTTVAAATTSTGTGSGQDTNLSMNRSVKPGSLTITLTNTSGAVRLMEGFYFDGAARFSQSARDFELTFGGAISGTAVTGTLANDSMPGVGAARDWGIDLTGLTDNEWEAGSNATFTLSFSGGDPVPVGQSGGGQETLVDNIGITVVPEPSSLMLFGLGGLALLRRRRVA